ncbi:putative DHNTP pyrophosphohydrolase [Pandoraea terrae]|uniref:Putative DHNTP pyrophosphohydrolase n=2 Tax=Pandoraea terrae TaxID=1537710 RepID=A0A5E4SYI2_9BURK|nr:putative DHNTP pyrophosphohydrolase [Pandoraea terrae]
MLMIFHPYLKIWLQPGGHIDAGETPGQAAQREVREETGVHTEVHPWHARHLMPLDIDIHPIAENPHKQEPAHYHYDFRYRLRVNDIPNPGQGEGLKVGWKALDEIDEPWLQDLIAKLEHQGLLLA